MTFNLARQRVQAFTLVELLVVIGIIALLISILLPVLSSAREAARLTACMAHLRDCGQGLAIYVAENRGFLPGPNTSGAMQSRLNNAFPVSHFESPTAPVQNMDWISPILGKSMKFPVDPPERYIAIFNNKLRCPTNDIYYTPPQYAEGSGVSVGIDPSLLNYNSYSAILGFHFRTAGSDPVNPPSEIYNIVQIPNTYSFRITAVGPAAEKIFAMEGSRFIRYQGSAPVASMNGLTRQIRGGNFMTVGPSLQNVSGTDYHQLDADLKPTQTARIFAYRHRGKINALFFDGHVQTLDGPESAKVDLYFPKGSVVLNSAGTADPNDTDGYVIP